MGQEERNVSAVDAALGPERADLPTPKTRDLVPTPARPFRRGSFCSATVLLECMMPTDHVCGKAVADGLFNKLIIFSHDLH
jgi:hypothetical protein